MIHFLQLGKARIFIFLLASLFMQNCSTNVRKESNHPDVKLIKVMTDGKLKSEITYGPDGLVKSWVWFNQAGAIVQRSKFIYTGTRLQRTDTYNEKSILERYITFDYNTDGELIQTNFFERENPNLTKLTPLQLRDYSLNFNPLYEGVIDETKSQKSQSHQPEYVGCEKYSYDANKFVAKADFFNHRNVEVGYCVYEHDNAGNMLNETWYDIDVENSVNCRFEYEYDNKNNAVLNINLPFVLERTFTNNILRKVGIGLGDTDSTTYNYEYNEMNFPTSATKINSEGEETEVVEYIYR